jgi:hypothetical protein
MMLQGFGLSIELPSGWSGRIYTETDGPDAPACSIVQAASVAIANNDDCILTSTRQNFGPADACIMLFESPARSSLDALYEAATLPASLAPSNFAPGWHGITPGQPTFVRRMRLNSRYFQLQAIFGSTPTVSQLALINQLLATLQVGQQVALTNA